MNVEYRMSACRIESTYRLLAVVSPQLCCMRLSLSPCIMSTGMFRACDVVRSGGMPIELFRWW